ncbi:hypothetical protein AMIS_60580 [Actinoplanes missouriensis 431]|uniref:DUF4375 domain-containing protein n=1 Tax=Actinoplanes missouriensis (strain ATCC 14538 / DSM 43046 / CBS 188.64 / JCM 3121 / NBRC 102363 / NCIMB 12654 / NRRL B-3342 / UNCC 431) TaxID=512565 RepID=I0HE41_ACTM4|nr:hypothetical protein [Actinoplanes missouriensis]BAL91278.1 hypothetical protein AMIS_60580 [Actinoplanes missouriensis 431]
MTQALASQAAEVVWSRARADLGNGPGDRHLRALLLVHGIVTNCGPAHAAISCEPAELTVAAEACRYLGLDDLAALLLRLPDATGSDSAERLLDEEYYELVPDDATIRRAFEQRYATTPDDFEEITARRFPRYHTAEK